MCKRSFPKNWQHFWQRFWQHFWQCFWLCFWPCFWRFWQRFWLCFWPCFWPRSWPRFWPRGGCGGCCDRGWGASIGSGRLGRLSSGGFDSVRSASVASFGSVRLGSPSQRGRADRPQHRFPPSRTNGWRKRVCRRGHGCFAVVLIRMTSSEPMIL